MATSASTGVLGAMVAAVLLLRYRKTQRLCSDDPEPAPTPTSLPLHSRVSAPGKVLITGGYLVLKRPLAGLVLASSARFHSTARWVGLPHGTDPPSRPRGLAVRVVSPQFRQTREFVLSSNPPFTLTPTDDLGDNPFLTRAIETAVLAADALHATGILHAHIRRLMRAGSTLDIVLEADNSFYSQSTHLEARSLPVNLASLSSLEPFLPCPVDPATGKVIVNKTGMGSSAALVTSLSAVVMRAFGCRLNTGIVHRVAQVAHGLAQGKIGSGFDVCAASFGTMRYVRVSSNLLSQHMAAVDTALSADLPRGPYRDAQRVLTAPLDPTQWDYSVTPFSLPPGLSLMMADVRGGSETPSMVRKILAWVNSGTKDPRDAWASLAKANERVEELFKQLHAAHAADPSAYQAAIDHCSRTATSEWAADGDSVRGLLTDLAATFVVCRGHLRYMGEQAGVPVEPPAQTSIADATSALAGVVCCGVPGAGGFDALFAVVVDTPETIEAVEQLWLASPGSICPLPLTAGAAHEGVREEEARN